jgi:hypothetical protein
MVIKFHSSQRAMPIWVPTLCAEAAHMLGTIHMCRNVVVVVVIVIVIIAVVVVVVVVVRGASQLANEAPMRPLSARGGHYWNFRNHLR